MPRMILALCFFLIPLVSQAQDTIYFDKGPAVYCKITELGIHTVKYALKDGPDYTIETEQIKYLALANGKQMYRIRVGHHWYLREGRYHEPVYGPNVITVMPIGASNTGAQHGLGYERALDSNGTFGLYIPVNYVISKTGGLGSAETSTAGMYSYVRKMVSVSPTLKVYMGGYRGKAKYSMGVGLYLATGVRDYTMWGTGTRYKEQVYHTGVLVHNACNFNASDNLYIGFEASGGYYKYFVPAQSMSGGRFLLSTGLRFGYRF